MSDPTTAHKSGNLDHVGLKWREKRLKQNLSSRIKQTPSESQPLSTLDKNELQLCDEQFTCHLEIQAQLLPMKKIMVK